jgi:type IV secretory pathway VirB2 component (pilin)
MINGRTRRVIAVILVVLGAILMFLAPEAWPGALVLILGVVLELVGIALEHSSNK